MGLIQQTMDLVGAFIGSARGTSYKIIDGEYWVKEPRHDWELLEDHMRKEHPNEYLKYYGREQR